MLSGTDGHRRLPARGDDRAGPGGHLGGRARTPSLPPHGQRTALPERGRHRGRRRRGRREPTSTSGPRPAARRRAAGPVRVGRGRARHRRRSDREERERIRPAELLVGSLGTLGLLAEVILRTNPIPAASRWLVAGDVDPFVALDVVHRAAAVLWDGTTTWVLLEGHGPDVDAETAVLRDRRGRSPRSTGPPPLPPHRWSLARPTCGDFRPSTRGIVVVARRRRARVVRQPRQPRARRRRQPTPLAAG